LALRANILLDYFPEPSDHAATGRQAMTRMRGLFVTE
jgi:hypothetical protein